MACWLASVVCWSAGECEVVEACNAGHGVVDAAAFESAAAEDVSTLHVGEGVLDAGPDLAVGGVVVFLPGRQFFVLVPAVERMVRPVSRWPSSAITVGVVPTAALAPESSQAPQSLRLPGSGLPTATTRRVSASITTWRFVE